MIGESFEPPCLNAYLTACAFDVTRRATAPVLAGAFRVRPNLSYEPVLVDQVRVDTTPFSLTYRLKQSARWSDGVPVTAEDLIFTFETIRNPANDIQSREGYDRIEQAEKVDSRTVRFVFDRPYSAWKSLFPQVLPKHVLEGKDFNTVWNASIVDPDAHEPFGSGPFLITEWLQGVQIGLTPNPGWWGSEPSLDAVVLRFVPDTTAQVEMLLAGELTAIHGPPAAQFAPLDGAPGISFESYPGMSIEHIDFNTESAAMPLLREGWFREAVAYALDRESSLDDAWGPLTIDVEPLDSLFHLRQQQEYKPAFARYRYDPDRVARIMKRNRCDLAADGIWTCRGTRASIRFATTTGNERRAFIQGQLADRARAAGIELVPDNSPGPVLFNERLPVGDYDLTMFTWLRLVDSFGLGELYGCNGAQNWLGYCSTRVTKLLEAADANMNRPAADLHRADAILADDVPTIPFYQAPLILAFDTALQGIVGNPGPQGVTWNVEEWRLD